MLGHTKGSSFERLVCRKLSLWWSDGKRDDIFWRNRVRVTSKTPNAEMQLGDIVAIRPEGIPLTDTFCFEDKSGYAKNKKKRINWDLLDLLDSKGKSVLLSFWEQAESQAALDNRIPALIFKRDYRPEPIIGFNTSLNKNLDEYIGHLLFIPRIMVTSDPNSPVYVYYRLQDWFNVIDPKTLKLFCENIREVK